MPTRRRIALLALALLPLLVAAFALAACEPVLPSDPPGITGTITMRVLGDGRPSAFSVEATGTQPSGSISDKAYVNIPPNTMFFDASGKAATLDEMAALDKGARVRVWFQGAVAESYPVQGSAKAVQILGK